MNPPDYSSVPDIPEQDWKYTPYSICSEDLPLDTPQPKGKPITLTHYFDANLMHDVLSEKAVLGTIHFWNKIPMDQFSKKQSTSETATYGSKFLTCRTCFEQTIDHQNYIPYLGPPVHPIIYAWGDNKSMINSAMNPDARLQKRHNIFRSTLSETLLPLGISMLANTGCTKVYTKVFLNESFTLKEILITFLKTIYCMSITTSMSKKMIS